VKKNLEQKVKEFVEESFKKEKLNYRNIIKDHIKEGFKFEKSYNKIDIGINRKLDDAKFESVYKDLSNRLEKIQEDYGIDKFNKAITSEEFQEELKTKNTTEDQFINIHKEYLAEFEMLKFHHQNREIFKKYFMIKYNPKLKDKIDYYDLNLYPGGRENDSLVNTEVERLHLILYPPSKSKNYKLEKYGIELTTKDIAVFMILFKDYYKINLTSYVEFVALSRLIFDDLHFNFKAGDTKLGTSIKRYIKGEDLFAGKFDYQDSKNKILGILSEIDLKDFKKYVEIIQFNKFKRLIKQNTNF